MARTVENGKAFRLEGSSPLALRRDWRPWRPQGYRILAEDGVTVWHEEEAIRRLVLRAFRDRDADVFLFGSHASGEAGPRSDYDVGFLTTEPFPAARLAEFKEQLEELPIAGQVELVDFRDVPERFSKIVLEKGGLRVWKTRRTNSFFTSTS